MASTKADIPSQSPPKTTFKESAGTRHHNAYIDQRLRFEQMISELSARFINVPPEWLDNEIEHALKMVLEFFQLLWPADRGPGLRLRIVPDDG